MKHTVFMLMYIQGYMYVCNHTELHSQCTTFAHASVIVWHANLLTFTGMYLNRTIINNIIHTIFLMNTSG